MKSSLFVKQALGALLFFSAIFLSAGRFCYWQGLVLCRDWTNNVNLKLHSLAIG